MRGPTWVGRVVLDDEWRRIYEVVRVVPWRGYPPPPSVEGRVVYLHGPATTEEGA